MEGEREREEAAARLKKFSACFVCSLAAGLEDSAPASDAGEEASENEIHVMLFTRGLKLQPKAGVKGTLEHQRKLSC